ncbi:hypothetical protein KR018_008392 [Drosophila ironensis]|nr:hypothetical protein KR018_008392 [Drosophila ironensis]
MQPMPLIPRPPPMAQLLLLGLGILAILSGHQSLGFHEETTRYPCAFIDTANITGSFGTNGTYVHNWQPIPRHLVAVYDFVIENGIRIPARRHLRACVCRLRPCVRICCPEGQLYDPESRHCAAQKVGGLPPLPGQSHMEVQLHNGTLQRMELSARFTVHVDTPCEHMRAVTKGSEYVHWTLHENGTVSHRGHVFSKHYCFTHHLLGNATWDWQPLACAPEKLHFVLGIREWTYAICLLISIISMFIVLMVYLLCSEMRNSFYGVAIKAYSICMILGYALLAYLTLHNPINLSNAACRILPGLALLYLVLSFYILSFISFKLYVSFHGVVFTKLMFWLIFAPIVIIAIGWSVYVSFSYYGSRLVFGGDTCWFDRKSTYGRCLVIAKLTQIDCHSPQLVHHAVPVRARVCGLRHQRLLLHPQPDLHQRAAGDRDGEELRVRGEEPLPLLLEILWLHGAGVVRVRLLLRLQLLQGRAIAPQLRRLLLHSLPWICCPLRPDWQESAGAKLSEAHRQ